MEEKRYSVSIVFRETGGAKLNEIKITLGSQSCRMLGAVLISAARFADARGFEQVSMQFAVFAGLVQTWGIRKTITRMRALAEQMLKQIEAQREGSNEPNGQ